MKFVTADLHLLHKNILKFDSSQKHRGQYKGNLDSMHRGIITTWNDQVSPDDTVFLLGDICCAKDKDIAHDLQYFLDIMNGHIILVRGNHDTETTVRIMKEFGHEVVDYYECRDFEDLICMSHYLHAAWNRSGYGSVHLFGHHHGSVDVKAGRCLDVGYDAWGKLLTLEEAYEFAKSREICSPIRL